MSLLNAQSIRNKACHIRDFVIDNDIDMFCITETWLSDNDSAIIAALTPESHILQHLPRSDKKGGGVGCIASKSLRRIKQINKKFDTFECIEIQISSERKRVSLNIIYRPPKTNFSIFLQELESLILDNEIYENNVVYLGDFNVWVDDDDTSNSQRFLMMLNNFNLVNLVNKPTCKSGHTLDLVITKKDNSSIGNLAVDSINVLSDHSTINFNLKFEYDKTEHKLIQFRKNNSQVSAILLHVLHNNFNSDNIDCQHVGDNPCVNCTTEYFKKLTQDIYDINCPLVKKNISVKGKNNKWYNTEIKLAKRNLRRAENKYRRNKENIESHNEFKRLRNLKCALVTRTKAMYYKNEINSCGNNSSKIFSHLNQLLGKNKNSSVLPCHSSSLQLANDFKQFFIEKIDTIFNSFQDDNNSADNFTIPDFPIQSMNILSPVTTHEVLKYMGRMNKTFCSNDSFDIRKFESSQLKPLATYLCDIVNCSFKNGIFPECEKMAYVRPMVKKDNDSD